MSDPLPVTIRLAAADDLDAVAAVWLAMDGRQDDLPLHGSLRTRIDDELAAGWMLYLALRDDRVVGMLALKPDEAILDQLFVVPEQWDSGIGTMLHDRAKQMMPGGFTLRIAAEDGALSAPHVCRVCGRGCGGACRGGGRFRRC